MRTGLLILILAIAVSGCGRVGYGPQQDHSEFLSSATTPDGRLGVFSHHRYVYRPAAGWRAFPDGGIPYYVRDENLLGILDMQTGKVRVVLREDNERYTDGQGGFFISHISDGKAVVSGGGQLRKDLSVSSYYTRMLDLATCELSPLPLREELESHGRGLAYFYMVDDEGTLVFITGPYGTDSDYVGKESNVKEVWVRHPDGEYELAAEVIHYYPTRDGLVHYFSTDHRYLAYDPDTDEVRTPPERYPPTWDDSATRGLTVSPDDRNRLSKVVWQGDDWHYEDAGVEVGELY